MKITTAAAKFRPITVVIETAEEAAQLAALIGPTSNPGRQDAAFNKYGIAPLNAEIDLLVSLFVRCDAAVKL